MAVDMQFAATPALGVALLGSAETNLQVPAQSALIRTAGTNGTKIEEIVVQATGTTLAAATVAGLVYLFLYDGTTYSMLDIVTVRPVPTPSATAAPYRSAPSDFLSGSNRYANLVLPPTTPTTWSLRASQSIAGNANVLKVFCFGGDL